MKPALPAVMALAAVLAGCGPATPQAGGRDQRVGVVPMPSGITCERNSAGYPERCLDR